MRRLHRSSKNAMIAGIFGGIAESYDIDPSIVRLIAVFLCLVTGIVPLVFTYIVAWIIIPKEA